MSYILQKHPINSGVWFQSETPIELQASEQLCQAGDQAGMATPESSSKYIYNVLRKHSHHNNFEGVKTQPNRKKQKTLITVNSSLYFQLGILRREHCTTWVNNTGDGSVAKWSPAE